MYQFLIAVALISIERSILCHVPSVRSLGRQLCDIISSPRVGFSATLHAMLPDNGEDGGGLGGEKVTTRGTCVPEGTRVSSK